jgi:hypothetical protein
MENIKIELVGETKTISLQLWTPEHECVCIYVDMVDGDIDKIYQYIDGEEVEDYEVEEIITNYINTNK